MRHFGLPALIGAMLICGNSYALDDSVWSNRHSMEGAKAAYDYYTQQYSMHKSFETAWKYSRAVVFYAGRFMTDNAEKKTVLDKAIRAAEYAILLGRNKPEGYHYYCLALGEWGQANGLLSSLELVPKAMAAANKGIEIAPAYQNAIFYVIRGRMYHKAPVGISVGDERKAESDYLSAIRYGPKNFSAYLYYAEFLLERGRKDEAKSMVQKGVAIPCFDPNSKDFNKLLKLKQQYGW